MNEMKKIYRYNSDYFYIKILNFYHADANILSFWTGENNLTKQKIFPTQWSLLYVWFDKHYISYF